MFGFLRPLCRTKEYRQLYCDSCVSMRENYGLAAASFISYEAVLFHAIAQDVELLPNNELVNLCITTAIPQRHKIVSEFHKKIGEFTSAFSLLLRKTKVEDDIHDDGSLYSRIIGRFYQKSFQKSHEYFLTLDSSFEKTMTVLFARQQQFETSKETVLLEKYAKPTADAFGYVFGLFGRLLEITAYRRTLAILGKHIGTAVIIADCARDWEKDKKKGHYNPIQSLNESAQAIATAQANLRMAYEITEKNFGVNSMTGQILRGVHDQLYALACKDKRYKSWIQPLPKVDGLQIVKHGKNEIITASVMCPPVIFASSDDCSACGCIVSCYCCCTLLALYGSTCGNESYMRGVSARASSDAFWRGYDGRCC